MDGEVFPQLLERPEEWRALGAARLTNLLCSALSFFQCGCPRRQVHSDLGSGEVAYTQREVIRRLEQEAILFCYSDSTDIGAAGRGRARLANAIVAAADCMQSYGSRFARPKEDKTKLLDAIPTSSLRIISECGHVPHLEKPGEVAYHIKDLHDIS